MLTNIIKKIKSKSTLAILAILTFAVFGCFAAQTTSAASDFNSSSADYDFGAYNATLDSSKVWQTTITADAGNQIKLRTYYHNSSVPAVTAGNATINLSITPTTTSNQFKVTSVISATGFTSFTEEAYIQLSSAESITFTGADWYNSYDGSAYTITPLSLSGSTATINLGSVSAGYAPNDGLVVFYASVSSAAVTTPTANAGTDQSVTVGSTVQLNGSSSTGTGLTYLWSCTGATLSNATIVNPTFNASSTSGTTHVCTLTVTDSSSNTATDTVNIVTTTSGGGGGTIISTGGGGGAIVYYGGSLSAEILNVTNNGNGAVTLNGKITECEKGNCTATFKWGTTATNLSNIITKITGLNKGDSFSYELKNLEIGKAYYVG
ncbi:MAG: hypothetical protein PHI87_06730, partial [Candidatus Methanomethylophilus sp.]|nr:hypothetical protein [Methanomethylophilus sp.]